MLLNRTYNFLQCSLECVDMPNRLLDPQKVQLSLCSTVTCHAPLPRLLSNGVSRCEIASLHCALLLLSLSLLLLLLIGYLCWIRCSRALSLTSPRRVVSRQYNNNNNNNNCKLVSSPSCQVALALDNLEIY